jgi:hypothetical protein
MGSQDPGARVAHHTLVDGACPIWVERPKMLRPGCVRCSSDNRRNGDHAVLTLRPSRPGEFHPEPLTDPDLTLSRHPARATARRLPPSIEYRVPPVAG